jgi:hypothetical protein
MEAFWAELTVRVAGFSTAIDIRRILNKGIKKKFLTEKFPCHMLFYLFIYLFIFFAF